MGYILAKEAEFAGRRGNRISGATDDELRRALRMPIYDLAPKSEDTPEIDVSTPLPRTPRLRSSSGRTRSATGNRRGLHGLECHIINTKIWL
jgi:hypothetical protein